MYQSKVIRRFFYGLLCFNPMTLCIFFIHNIALYLWPEVPTVKNHVVRELFNFNWQETRLVRIYCICQCKLNCNTLYYWYKWMISWLTTCSTKLHFVILVKLYWLVYAWLLVVDIHSWFSELNVSIDLF